jgi:hypothetical protein
MYYIIDQVLVMANHATSNDSLQIASLMIHYKFTESLQMKLDKDPFLMNMNMVELDGKKILVRPSQAESTKGKDVIVGEERPPRMIKPKSLKGGQWQKNEGASRNNVQRPPSTFSWLSTRKAGTMSGVAKIRPSRIPNRIV